MTTILQWEWTRRLLTRLARLGIVLGSAWWILVGALFTVETITWPNSYTGPRPDGPGNQPLPFDYIIWGYLFPWMVLISSVGMIGLVIWKSLDENPPPQRTRWKPFYPLLLVSAFVIV